LGREKSLQFRSGFIGRELEVVVLRKRDRRGRGWLALSDNYLPILIQDQGEEGIGQLVSIVAEGMDQDLLLGRRKE
jgi:tRNA A37 methylthiotransferase MiaB